MPRLRDAHYVSALNHGYKIISADMADGGSMAVKTGGNHWFVDGDKTNSGDGLDPDGAFKTVGEAITAAQAYDVIRVFAKKHTDYTGDPVSYEENLVIPYAKSGLAIIGESRGLSQGGLPQFKDGSVTTDPILKVRAPGCLIRGIGFNGAGNTGGGILFDDDYTTKAAFGTGIYGCHFKNCKGPDEDDAKEGGAIMWSTEGNSWQVTIKDNHFYKNVADITLMGTSNTRPQDVMIQGNTFSGDGVSTDCNIYGAAGGFGYVTIDRNVFGTQPSLGANVNLYMDLTGTLLGRVTNNVFGCIASEAASNATFGAAGDAALIPTTVWMAGNTGEPEDTGASNDFGAIFRT